MAITDGTVIRVVASLLFPDNVIAQNVFHLVATDLSGGNDPDDVVQDMEEYIDDIYDAFDGFISDIIDPGEIKVYEYDPVDDDFDEIGTGVMTTAPTGATEMLPHGVAVVQNFYCLDPDVQGRKFWGGIIEASNEDGSWGASLITGFIAGAALVVANFTSTVLSNVYAPVVWSPTQLDAVPYTGVVGTNVVPGYQRRRKPGVGI